MEDKNTDKKIIIIAVTSLIVLVIGPIVLKYFFNTGDVWLGFWGSYFGSTIGAIATFIAFYFTYKSNNEQHKETQTKIEDQERLAILPFLNVFDKKPENVNQRYSDTMNICLPMGKQKSELDMPKTLITSIVIENIGQAAAIGVLLKYLDANIEKQFFELGNIPQNGSILISLSSSVCLNDPITFKLIFKDLGGKTYSQEFKMNFFPSAGSLAYNGRCNTTGAPRII